MGRKLFTDPAGDDVLRQDAQDLRRTGPGTCWTTGECDWAMGELLAYGSLLAEGHAVRLSGQDWSAAPSATATPCLGGGQRRGVHPAGTPGPGQGPVRDLQLPAFGIRRDGLRIRLSPRPHPGTAGLGGAVRRFRQRRPDHHRPVPRRRGGQVERINGLVLCCPMATRARARSTPPPAWSASSALRRQQHAAGELHHAGQLLPRAAPPACASISACRWWSSRRRACCATRSASARWRTSPAGRFQEVIDDAGADPEPVSTGDALHGQALSTSCRRSSRRTAGRHGHRPAGAALPRAAER